MHEPFPRRVRFVWLLVLIAVSGPGTFAHPGNGIVVQSDGAVLFADVLNETIWRLAPDGALSPLVRDRWTHCLFLADDGTLYYEREEPVDGVAPCSLWRITPGGEHRQIIPPQSDRRQFAGGEFVVDDTGNVFYAHTERDAANEWRSRIMKRTPAGEVSVFSGGGDGPLYRDGPADRATIRIVTSMASGPSGAIYFTDRDHVRRIAIDGTVTTIASGLIDETPADPPFRRGPPTTVNRLYGLTVADDGTILVAYQAGRRVIEIGGDGVAKTIYQSSRPWSPLGVAVRGETRYVLETGHERGSDTVGPRVRRIAPDGSVTTVALVTE